MQVQLSTQEARSVLLTHPVTGERYYLNPQHQLHRLTATGGTSTRYTDADDRPGDHSHDGNGWTEQVRDYTIDDQPAPDEIRNLILGLENTDRAFWQAMVPAERESYFTAVTAWWSSLQPNGKLGLQLLRDGQGGWTTAPFPAEVKDEDLDTR